MAKKLKKESSEDLFAGLKVVDNMLNKAAGINESASLTLDQRLKKRLTESMEETSTAGMAVAEENSTMPEASMEEDMGATAPLDSEMEDEGMREYNYSTDNYNYQANDRGVQFGEEEDEDFLNTDKEEDPFMEDPDLLEMLLEDDDLAVEDPTAAPAGPEMDTEMGAEMGTDAAAPEMADLGGAPEMGADAGADMGMDAGVDMGADMGGMDMGAAPTGGMDMGADAGVEAGAGVDATAVSATPDVTASPEDIDALIDGILMENQELKDLGYEDLGDDELSSTVKNAGNGGPKIKLETSEEEETKEINTFKEGETPKSTKLDTQEITGNVKGAGENKNGDAEKATADLDFVDAKDKDFGSAKVRDEKPSALHQKAFDKVKAESALKDKALTKLAEKYVALEEENKKLKLENYKATKVNHVLTLLPELKQKTREALVKSFSEAKDFAAVRKLYTDVQTMIKENARPSLNEAVSKVSKSVKHIVAENTNPAASESADQARKNFLMGIEGYEDQYFNH